MIAEFLGYLRDIWFDILDCLMILFRADVAPDWHFILKILLIGIFFLGSACLAATIAETRRHKMKFHFLLGLLVPYIYPLVLFWRLKIASEAVEEEFDPSIGMSNSMTARFNEIHEEQEEKKQARLNRFKPAAAEPEQKDDEVDPLKDLSDSMTARLNEICHEQEEKEQTRVKRSKTTVAKQQEETEPEAPAEPEPVAEESAKAETSVFNQRYFQGLAVDSSGAKVGPFKLVTCKDMEFKVVKINNIQNDMASFEVEVKGSIKNIRLRYDNIKTFEKI